MSQPDKEQAVTDVAKQTLDEGPMKKLDKLLERMRWQASVDGRVEGALAVLSMLDGVSREEKISMLAKAVGLSTRTATELYDSVEEAQE